MARVFTAHTPLGDDGKFHSFTGHEEISRLFDCTLTLASLNNSVPMNALLGQSVTVEVEREDKSRRYFNGYVTACTQVRRDGRYFLYEARVQPQFYYLTQTRDFKIFQKMTARDIIKQVLSEYGIALKDQLGGYYRMREYTVCYGESYFDFVSRMMEEEGIAYWFEHSNGSHTMVLCDSISGYPTLPSHATIPYYPPDMAGIPDQEFISAWNIGQSVNPGKISFNDYDFKKPKANLLVIQPKPRDHPHSNYEVYDYPGVYREHGDGDNYGRVNIESVQTRHERATGDTNVRGFSVGYRFSLTRCPRADQNREYLIVESTYDWVDNSYEGGRGSKVVVHDTSFNVQPTSDPFRPERTTPYPVAYATDSAIVTGPPGQEIWTDNHGRVKVHFHWDRHGPKDQNSSCWVRVAQPWAGSNFGAMHIPRIGQEVLIGYVNNNPDFPIITSRVYNADNMPPWDLPANATQSGILTRSTKDGGYNNANAIRFEDKKGEEQLWLHAEKDQLTEVEHDEDKWVGNDRRKTIDRDETNHIKRDRTETVDRDETITVHNNRKERVDHNETISIGDNRKEDVGINEDIKIGNNQSLDVGSDRTKSVGDSESDKIGKNWNIRVGMFKMENIGLAFMQNIGLAKMVNIGTVYNVNVGLIKKTMVGMSDSTTVGKTQSVSVGKTQSTKVGEKYSLTVGGGGDEGGGGAGAGGAAGGMMTSNIVAPSGGASSGGGDGGGGGKTSQIIMDGETITLQTGQSKIVLKADGKISITGVDVEINGQKLVDVKSKLIDMN